MTTPGFEVDPSQSPRGLGDEEIIHQRVAGLEEPVGIEGLLPPHVAESLLGIPDPNRRDIDPGSETLTNDVLNAMSYEDRHKILEEHPELVDRYVEYLNAKMRPALDRMRSTLLDTPGWAGSMLAMHPDFDAPVAAYLLEHGIPSVSALTREDAAIIWDEVRPNSPNRFR